MKFATRDEFEKLAKQDKYYNPARWDLYTQVQRLIRHANPESVLELGAYRFPLVTDCDTMDRTAKFNPTIAHDAQVTPWPISDHAYEMFVSLQVWEHLKGDQRQAFGEVKRIAKQAILSFPYRWDCLEKNPSHHAITEEIISDWTLGTPPEEVIIVPSKNNHRRIIYRFDFSKQNGKRKPILLTRKTPQRSLSEPVPTLRRVPEDCRYRIVESDSERMIAHCQFVELMFEKHGQQLEYPVQRDACLACVAESEPTPNNFNTVVSSLIYSQAQKTETSDDNSEQLEQLTKQAENGLRMVMRDQPSQQPKQRTFGDCKYFANRLTNEAESHTHTTTYECNHPQHPNASEKICHLCSDHQKPTFNHSESLIHRMPLKREAQAVNSWMVGVTTSPRQLSTLDQSLDSIIRAGWPSPWLFLDSAVEIADRHLHLPVTYREAATGAWSNFYLSLAELMHRDPHADAYMMLQDDVQLTNSENLRHYLEQVLWPNEQVGVISLFCSAEYDKSEEGWHTLDQHWVWGALAFIFSNKSAWEFIADPQVIAHRKSNRFDGTRLVDVTVGNWLQRTNKDILYPVPSLAQHTGARSTLWESATNENKRQAGQFVE